MNRLCNPQFKMLLAVLVHAIFVQDLRAQDQITFASRVQPIYYITSVIPSEDGYLSVGGGSAPFAFKLDKKGRLIWRREFVFNGAYFGAFTSALQTRSGDYIFLGRRQENTSLQSDPVIVRVTKSGSLVWKKVFHAAYSDFLNAAIEMDNGDFLFAGDTQTFAMDGSFVDGWTLRLTSSGDFVASRTFHRKHGADGQITSIVKVRDGLLLIGSTDFFTYGPSRGLVIKTNGFGEPRWARSYFKTNGWVDVVEAVPTANNGAVIAGTFTSVRGMTSSYDPYLMQINSNGAIQWKKSYSGKEPNFLTAKSATNTTDGGFVLVGDIFNGSNVPDDGFLLKVNSLGKTVWSRRYGDGFLEQLDFINSSNDGGLIGIGTYDAYPFFFKLTSAGFIDSCGSFKTATFRVKFPQISVSTTSLSGIAINLQSQNLSLSINASNPPIESFCDKLENSFSINR